jgi:prepilin-type N-terminal cleavage/methylation domain-containing protein
MCKLKIKKRTIMNTKGFTLTELLIVLAIISILAMISVPAYIGQQKSAARTEAYSNLQNLRLLEEQFFAENGAYTASAADVAAIQALLSGFRPGTGLSFNYTITQDVALVPPAAVPYDGATAAQNPCFVATATGIAGTRVDSDVFAIDCNNNRNF